MAGTEVTFGVGEQDLVAGGRLPEVSRRLVGPGQAGPCVQGDRVSRAEQPPGVGHRAPVQGDGVAGRPAEV